VGVGGGVWSEWRRRGHGGWDGRGPTRTGDPLGVNAAVAEGSRRIFGSNTGLSRVLRSGRNTSIAPDLCPYRGVWAQKSGLCPMESSASRRCGLGSSVAGATATGTGAGETRLGRVQGRNGGREDGEAAVPRDEVGESAVQQRGGVHGVVGLESVFLHQLGHTLCDIVHLHSGPSEWALQVFPSLVGLCEQSRGARPHATVVANVAQALTGVALS
jgi:hypothetical protein